MSFDDFFSYIASVGYWKLIRIFWYYFLFEFFRYIFIEFIGISLWKLKRILNRNKWKDAKRKFLQENPKISIIVPGKNEGKHIYKLAKSLKEQSYKNFEIIIVDDGSDDLTPEICKNLQKNGFIDLFLRNEVRGGKASAANLALRFATGKYIVHLDADCSYDSDAIEKIIIPFYYDRTIGAVGGNVMVRNYDESLITTLQAIEYLDAISIGRTVSSELGIYRVISGAFGAFSREALDRLGGWDIGPGLDGDITVKVRKLGYKIFFEPNAVCLTNAPNTVKKLVKQRLRWDKSLVRFRLRKHRDVFFPTYSFRFSNFFSFAENITYNLILNITWFLYIMDMVMNYSSELKYIITMNILLYTVNNYFKFLFFAPFRERKHAPNYYFLPYIPLMVFYFGYFLRIVRSIAYVQEFLFKASYNDPWNPQKSSRHAKAMRL
jgi:cellulose synthase/poly-beta-1,6-N-acetylglucosamine synthase-like glycosyltransferase